jgi:hypothetical protein
MISKAAQTECILAIAPTTRGFGFAVLEREGTLVDWGVRTVSGDKNAESLKKIQKLIGQFAPQVLVIENYRLNPTRRSDRIFSFGDALSQMAKSLGVRAKSASIAEVRKVLFHDAKGTKYAIAEHLVRRFPDELSHLMPRKRILWKSEDYRMMIFDAVALAVTQIVPR